MADIKTLVKRIKRIDALIADKKTEADLKTPFVLRRKELLAELKKSILKIALIGRMAGILNGISMRKDAPNDIREICQRIYKNYKALYNED